MNEQRLRQLAVFGLALAAIGMIGPGFHHIRCEAAISASPGGGQTVDSAPCQQTFPSEWLPFFAASGLLGAILALAAAYGLGRSSSKLRAGRIVLALAAIALLVPTILPILGWASVGFDLRIQTDQPDGGRYCTGGSGPFGMPFWLQTPTCLSWLDVITTPLVALAGVLAAGSAWRGSRTILLAALATAGIALVVYVAWIAAGQAEFARTSLVPFLGILLAVAAIPMLRTSAARSA